MWDGPACTGVDGGIATAGAWHIGNQQQLPANDNARYVQPAELHLVSITGIVVTPPVMAALFTGWFDRRRLALAWALTVCLLWLLATTMPPALGADIAEMPNHGSFTGASADWFKEVSPQVVLQSSGPRLLTYDRWQ